MKTLKVDRDRPLDIEDAHIGRSFGGHPLEDECPCPQVECGLVSTANISDECEEHTLRSMKTMRQGHKAENCPAVERKICPECGVSHRADDFVGEICGWCADA